MLHTGLHKTEERVLGVTPCLMHAPTLRALHAHLEGECARASRMLPDALLVRVRLRLLKTVCEKSGGAHPWRRRRALPKRETHVARYLGWGLSKFRRRVCPILHVSRALTGQQSPCTLFRMLHCASLWSHAISFSCTLSARMHVAGCRVHVCIRYMWKMGLFESLYDPDSAQSVYLSHGWSAWSLREFKAFNATKVFQPDVPVSCPRIPFRAPSCASLPNGLTFPKQGGNHDPLPKHGGTARHIMQGVTGTVKSSSRNSGTERHKCTSTQFATRECLGAAGGRGI